MYIPAHSALKIAILSIGKLMWISECRKALMDIQSKRKCHHALKMLLVKNSLGM